MLNIYIFCKNVLVCQKGVNSSNLKSGDEMFTGVFGVHLSYVYLFLYSFQLYTMGAGSTSSERCLPFISTSTSRITEIS